MTDTKDDSPRSLIPLRISSPDTVWLDNAPWVPFLPPFCLKCYIHNILPTGDKVVRILPAVSPTAPDVRRFPQ